MCAAALKKCATLSDACNLFITDQQAGVIVHIVISVYHTIKHSGILFLL
jgi:hypothetical protein